MRKPIIALLLVLMWSSTGFPQAQKLRDLPNAQGRRQNVAPRRAPIQEAVRGLYVSQFQEVIEVSDEVFVKALPFLNKFILDRFEIIERRRRALNQLRMVIDSGSDDEIKRLKNELDDADTEIQTNQQNFMAAVDPLLSIRQQGKLRMFLDTTDQQIRRILTGIQNATPANRQNNQKN